MTSIQGQVGNHHDWMRGAAKAGYAARGIVFLIIGFFSFKAAYATGRPMGERDALDEIARQPLGQFVIFVLVAALFAFALWRLAQAVMDIDRHGKGAKGLVIRAGLLASAVTYAALAVYAASATIGLATGGGGTGGEMVAKAYRAGYGQWITYAIALAMAGAGAAHMVKGIRAGFEKYMTIPPERRAWLKPVCQFGLIARGVTFFILAGLLVTGAESYGGEKAPGLEDVLGTMADWSSGWLLLSLTGLGLMAFGAYAIAEAHYRRIPVEKIV
ncbi:DUF1206 domain-containing protein [Aurantimonas sp. Leaf443]|uniref:DUF1206 domain-containing protein n=1 Tax=Aurantimonas sp. Leaf443 TaxID=1736378 RepID=UPI0007020C10|nr:DUF1206 domain-containing protein [Aurantimonas sp. Leaf443]KQT86084.1 hypothetical protein ASG48_05745 [Aurantimonas sp. Leaf443]